MTKPARVHYMDGRMTRTACNRRYTLSTTSDPSRVTCVQCRKPMHSWVKTKRRRNT
jgi:hypothetical protein